MAIDHFSGHAVEYARARPNYPKELFDWITEQCMGYERAWDCGTGNGQAARALVSRFQHIHATDLSAEQIAQATAHPRITYLATPAEQSQLPDASCDLVTVAQALHWFCSDDFYAEVRRVLKSGGVLAAWTYTLLRGDPELNAVIDDFHTRRVGPWWPPERRWVENSYRDLPFALTDMPTPVFEIRLDWSLPDLLDYLRTWSATQRCIQQTGVDPTLELEQRLLHLWPEPATRKTLIWPIALRCGRDE